MPKKTMRTRRVGTLILVLAGLAGAVGYGIAQNTVVTQAEWAVYMVRALKLDWNLPENPKSNHYIARLSWETGIDVSATGLEPGSSSALRVENGCVQAEGGTAEALYRVSTIRTGDYGFRLRMANGAAVVKIGPAVFEAYQPDDSLQWVDFNRITLDPGDHAVSVLLEEGARADMLGVSPPCLNAVEPPEGWNPLQPLTYGDLAVTIARALELEYGLAGMGPETTIKGEDFTVLMDIPIEEGTGKSEEPFWLSSGGSLMTARARFTAQESGVYAIQARYFSSRELRWTIDGCLRAVTCPAQVGSAGLLWTNVLTVKLDAGEHDLGITLPPGASLDQVMIQQKDDSIFEYLGTVTEEGFSVGRADEEVSRRRAIAAALQLRSLFERWKGSRCADTLVALEEIGALLVAGGRRESESDTTARIPGDRLPGVAPGGDSGRNPIFPTGPNEPDVASPLKPSPGGS